MVSPIKKITTEKMDELILESKFSKNSLSIRIPFAYALNLVVLNWNDVMFGIDNGYFSYDSAIEFALNEYSNSVNYSQNVLKLAVLSPSEVGQEQIIHQYLSELSSEIPEKNKDETKEKIMYIILNWLYEHKENYCNPLKVIEIIYDDFDFPKSIMNLIQYMPSAEINSINTEQKSDINYYLWSDYLCKQKIKYSF